MSFPIRKLLLSRSILKDATDFLRQPINNPLPRFFPGFQHWSQFRRHFVQNLLIGIVIEVLVVLCGHWHVGVVTDTQNALLDSLMKLSSDTLSGDPKHPTQLFIDVDEQTYRSPLWGGGEPSALPLDKIADLIKEALANGARYVLIDFAIDGARDERQDNFISRLEAILKQYPNSHLLFVRTLRQPLETSTVRAVRFSALDKLIEKHADNVHAVAPNFLRSSDHVLRHWRLWESACYPAPERHGEGHWVIVPSPQLMITSLENNLPLPWPMVGQPAAEALPCAVDGAEPDLLARTQSARMADWLAGRWVWENLGTCYLQDSFKADSCGKHGSPPAPEAQNEVTAKLEGETLANRILFRQSDWVRKHTEAVRQGEALTIRKYPPYFDRLPAMNVLAGPPDGPAAVALGKLKNAAEHGSLTIAVIGASYEDSRDTHLTPLGEMPGSLVLVNAIDTMQTIVILQSPNPWFKFTIVVLILVGISTAFALLTALWAAVLMFALVVLTIGPLSFWLLKQGIWLDFGAPIIGIYLHREWEDLLERRSRKSQH